MPGMRTKDRVQRIATDVQERRVKERPEVEKVSAEVEVRRQKQTKEPLPSTVPSSVEYSESSTIAATYARGSMPKRHRDLYGGIVEALGPGVSEGEIILGQVLDKIGMGRRSAANILKHLENFGYLRHERQHVSTYIWLLK